MMRNADSRHAAYAAISLEQKSHRGEPHALSATLVANHTPERSRRVEPALECCDPRTFWRKLPIDREAAARSFDRKGQYVLRSTTEGRGGLTLAELAHVSDRDSLP